MTLQFEWGSQKLFRSQALKCRLEWQNDLNWLGSTCPIEIGNKLKWHFNWRAGCRSASSAPAGPCWAEHRHAPAYPLSAMSGAPLGGSRREGEQRHDTQALLSRQWKLWCSGGKTAPPTILVEGCTRRLVRRVDNFTVGSFGGHHDIRHRLSR